MLETTFSAMSTFKPESYRRLEVFATHESGETKLHDRPLRFSNNRFYDASTGKLVENLKVISWRDWTAQFEEPKQAKPEPHRSTLAMQGSDAKLPDHILKLKTLQLEMTARDESEASTDAPRNCYKALFSKKIANAAIKKSLLKRGARAA